ncbi:uncharacterized protein LOC121383473 isoform X1 [Gigantopelta aegis]|uniref:uncharacterized protein LOC121383473 isoform X1 n=1 Tax=Gigantopelta aegis TaxID=1735272 RepID=UPI001B887ED3|nr:uncharacterized protein LOC121383473 isoform X1 [Gigantopelta aegis]
MMLLAACLCVMMLVGVDAIDPRRTDITDLGYGYMFQGWVDIKGQGANNDYCRVVGPSANSPYKWLSCALSGTQGDSQYNYNPPNGGLVSFDAGYTNTWYMSDANGDGRADYCRCVGNRPNTYVSCMLAKRLSFGSNQYECRVPGSNGC